MDDELNSVGVYMFHNQNTGEVYVGSSGNVNKRKRGHETKLKANKHVNKRFQEAYLGDPNFDFISVPTKDRDEAFDLEQSIISEYVENPLFLNLSRNARYCNVECSDKTRQKISLANKGLVRSEETKDKIRLAKVGIPRSEEVKEKLRQFHLGSTLSDITKTRMSEVRKGMILPPRTSEHIEKIRIAKADFKHDDSTIERIRNNAPNSRSVSIEGVEYRSISEAERQVGFSYKTIRARMDQPEYPNWFYTT